MKIEDIAKVCHQTNKAFCEAFNDYSQTHWDSAPEWQKESAINGVTFHLNGVFGPEASHNNWMIEKQRDGWKYGDVKDHELKTHPCMIPFEELPLEQKAKDFLFRSVVHSLKKYLE